MKVKSLIFIVAAMILLSFTVSTRHTQENSNTKKAAVKEVVHSSPSRGLAMEDRNQWD